MNVEESLESWIFKELSAKQKFLGGLPPCPYAAEALINGRISVQETSASEAFNQVIGALETFFRSTVQVRVIAVPDWKNISAQETRQFVTSCRERFYQNDLWLLYDHPEVSETICDFSFNQGSFLLFMVQKLSDLVLSSQELKKTGYYENWDPQYYSEVVLLREKYYERLSVGQTNYAGK